MNITITMDSKTSLIPAQTFTDVRTPEMPPFYCAASKTPYQYFKDANLISREHIIYKVPDRSTIYSFLYIYHSGVCFRVDGAEHFSEKTGDTTIKAKSVCYAKNDVTMLNQDQNTTLRTALYERYKSLGGDEYTEYNVTSAIIYYTDGPSGGTSSHEEYNFTIPRGRYLPVPQSYVITPISILPSIPFAFYFRIYVERVGPDGSSSVGASWYLPVLGMS
jgi:hypothetical protein